MRHLPELGNSLRVWRERLDPEDVGLSRGPRRRTRGLRRREVADLAGVSPDYLVQLEQGRAANPSTQVLTGLARALRLSPTERDHMLQLAGYRPLLVRPERPSAEVARLVDQLGAVPAGVYDECWNPVVWNPLWANTNGDRQSCPVIERNMLYRLMTGLPMRAVRTPAETTHMQRLVVGDLRATLARHGFTEYHRDFVRLLSARSTRFRELWAAAGVDTYRHEIKTLEHPTVGSLDVACDILGVGTDDLRLVVYTPAPRSASADRLRELFETAR